MALDVDKYYSIREGPTGMERSVGKFGDRYRNYTKPLMAFEAKSLGFEIKQSLLALTEVNESQSYFELT